MAGRPKRDKKEPSGIRENVEIPCRDADVFVSMPLIPTEFDVQMALYSRLSEICRELDNHTSVKSEICITCDGQRSRFDLMIIKRNGPGIELLCGIEVKRCAWSYHNTAPSRQDTAYTQIKRNISLPIIYCVGMRDIDLVCKKVKNIIA